MVAEEWVEILVLWVSSALAGSGPWVIGEGQGTLFVGVESQRLTRLAIVVDGERDVVDVGEGLSAVGVKVIGSVGLTPRFELQGELPYWRVQANRTDVPLCSEIGVDLGREACETTSSVGVLSLRAKGLLVDEFYGGPLSLALGAELRAGDFSMATRERLTNVGEGGLDAGAFVSVGRTGAIGSEGYWSGYVEVLARYRSPLRRTFPERLGDRRVPGSELVGTAEWIVAPRRRVAFGPVVAALWRPFGVDWGDVDLSDQDRFGSLRVLNVRAGGTVAIRGPSTTVATVTVLQTVMAVNNPVDTLSVGVGLQTLLGGRRPPDDAH